MKKEWLKKLQLGGLSLATLALLVACGTNDMDEPPVDGEPGVEDPVDGVEDPMDEDTDADDAD